MGIKNLLPQLKDITKEIHIQSYAGQTVAIDGYSWLHKVAIPCSTELVRGEPTDRYIHLFLSKIALLQRNGVRPFVVFDGGHLPMKNEEEEERARARQQKRELAERCLARGLEQAARDAFQSAVDVNPRMVKALVLVLERHGIQFLVAPYEADAQLAYLARNNLVHAVISEDSDMLVYGCPRVLFKLDWRTGIGQEITIANLEHNRRPSFRGWDHQLFVQLCILMGCDFLKSPKGVGEKKAYQLMQRLRSFTKVCRTLRRFERHIQFPPAYECSFQRAIWTFRHQRVFCPIRRCVVHLTDIPEGGLAEGVEVPEALPSDDDVQLDFLGPPLPDHIAQGIANATLDPFTYDPLEPAPLPPPRSTTHLSSSHRPSHHGRPSSSSSSHQPTSSSTNPWSIAAGAASHHTATPTVSAPAPPTTRTVVPACYAPSQPSSSSQQDTVTHVQPPHVLSTTQQTTTVLNVLSQLDFPTASSQEASTAMGGGVGDDDNRHGMTEQAEDGDADGATRGDTNSSSDANQGITMSIPQQHTKVLPKKTTLRRGISRFFTAPRPMQAPTATQLRDLLQPATVEPPTQQQHNPVVQQHHQMGDLLMDTHEGPHNEGHSVLPALPPEGNQTPEGEENIPPPSMHSEQCATPLPMTALHVFACAAKRSIDTVKGAIASSRGSNDTPRGGKTGTHSRGHSGARGSGAGKRRKVVGRATQAFQPPRRMALVLETPVGPFARFALGAERKEEGLS